MENKYYVYKHVDGNDIVYIGYGCHDRVCRSNSRSEPHAAWMEKSMMNNVMFYEVTHSNLTKQEAQKVESEMIVKFEPKFNVMKTSKQVASYKHRQQKVMKPVNTPDGTFESRNAAADFYNVTPAVITYRVNKGMYQYEDIRTEIESKTSERKQDVSPQQAQDSGLQELSDGNT